jgi:hypothetical protein
LERLVKNIGIDLNFTENLSVSSVSSWNNNYKS